MVENRNSNRRIALETVLIAATAIIGWELGKYLANRTLIWKQKRKDGTFFQEMTGEEVSGIIRMKFGRSA
jgi:hypothetical protein